jgi:hypothetical protein
MKDTPIGGEFASGFVFTSDRGEVIVPEKINVVHKEMLQRANLPHVRFHDLRHSCATLLLSKGITLKMIQEILGHADFQTTANIYSHVVESASQHPLHMPIAQLARRTWPRLIQQTVEASIEKPLPPLARRRQRASLPACDLGVAQPLARQQDNP